MNRSSWKASCTMNRCQVEPHKIYQMDTGLVYKMPNIERARENAGAGWTDGRLPSLGGVEWSQLDREIVRSSSKRVCGELIGTD